MPLDLEHAEGDDRRLPAGVYHLVNGGTGHLYQAVPGFPGLSWTLASQLAQAEGGYLATITSAQDNAFVFTLVDSPGFWTGLNGSGPALGGLQAEGSQEPDGGWYWITGEPWSYSNWFPGQPDDWPGGPWHEDRLEFFSGVPWMAAPTWNDIGADDTNLGGFVVEKAAPVPETAGGWLLLSGLAVLGGCWKARSWSMRTEPFS